MRSHCRAQHWLTQTDMWAPLCLGLHRLASFNMYLERWIRIGAEIPNMCLYGLETSQGRDCGAELGKHSFLLRLPVWTGNKEADQTLAQKATTALSWKGVAGPSKPFQWGETWKITCHFYFGKLFVWHKSAGRLDLHSESCSVDKLIFTLYCVYRAQEPVSQTAQNFGVTARRPECRRFTTRPYDIRD